MNTTIGNSINRNMMMGTEQLAQVLLPTEIVGYTTLLLGIANPLNNYTENWVYPTIQPIIFQYTQATGPENSDREYFPLGSLDSGTYVPISRRNIVNRTGMNPQAPIVITIPHSNIAKNCNIFDSVSRTPDLDYRGSLWNGAEKSEIKNLRGNNIFENAERKNNFEVEKVGREKFGIWNHKSSFLVQVDLNQTKSNQPISANSRNIGSINDSTDICAIEKKSSSVNLVYTSSTVPALKIFTFGIASDP